LGDSLTHPAFSNLSDTNDFCCQKEFSGVRKLFFLAARSFFLLQELSSYFEKKILREKILGQGKKNCFVNLSRGICLASEKNYESVGSYDVYLAATSFS